MSRFSQCLTLALFAVKCCSSVSFSVYCPHFMFSSGYCPSTLFCILSPCSFPPSSLPEAGEAVTQLAAAMKSCSSAQPNLSAETGDRWPGRGAVTDGGDSPITGTGLVLCDVIEPVGSGVGGSSAQGGGVRLSGVGVLGGVCLI